MTLMGESFWMKFAAPVFSIVSINYLAVTSGATIRCSTAFVMRTLKDISACKRTVALKLTMVITKSILLEILMMILLHLSVHDSW